MGTPVKDGRLPRFRARRILKARWLVILVVLALGGSALVSRTRERNRFDPDLQEEARQAVDAARRSPGASWSPEVLASAEGTYLRGMEELRRQRSRFVLWRDLRPVADTLELVRERAQDAIRAGDSRMRAGKQEAASELERVSEVMELLDELDARASLTGPGRVGLSAARMGFVEASALMEEGEYAAAGARARKVLAQAREVTGILGDAFLRFADEERVGTWRKWIAETVAWSRTNGAVALVVIKERNALDVYRGGRRILTLPADMGSNNLAQKYRQGDRATPEGRYHVRRMKGRGQTVYHKALLLDYPTAEDLRRIRAAGEAGIVPLGAGPGALIEIHGEGGRGEDWTNGCVAVTNLNMDELFRLVKVGTPVTIVGGDGSTGTFSALAERFQR